MVTHKNSQVIFQVVRSPQGRFSASCLNANISSTRGDSLEELHDNLTDALRVHFGDQAQPDPKNVHLLMHLES